MRISDWSSDVCSSDLVASAHRPIAMTGCFQLSTWAISDFIVLRGTLTQPAVAPLPLMCRKIAPPRWRTWRVVLKLITIAISYCSIDRKRVVQGKEVDVRGDFGVRR